jgi:3-oxoacyl-[acyl-carrier protein] reductase
VDLGLTGVPAAVAAASRGLGFAVARELAAEGARVAICSRDQQAASDAASSIHRDTGGEVHALAADVSTAEGAVGFVDGAAERLGGLQVLVVNAGGPPPGPATGFDDEAWLRAFELNFLSAVRLVRTALPHLEQRPWGRILCITSTSVRQPIPNLALSNAIRLATTGFAKTLAGEVGPGGITVNCLLPGNIATDRLRSLAGAPPGAGPEDPAFAAMAAQIPLGRVGTPEEFGAVAAFLCSTRASFVNGLNLPVDGGLLRALP